jgi:hypothetical protein
MRSLIDITAEIDGMNAFSNCRRAWLAADHLLRRKRLGDVHAKLLMGRPDVMVREIAIENGFSELDRFAASCRRQFSQLTVAHFAAAYRTVAIGQRGIGIGRRAT